MAKIVFELDIIKETIDYFEKGRLPTNLDVLQRLASLVKINPKKTLTFSSDIVFDEMKTIYDQIGFPTVGKKVGSERIRNLKTRTYDVEVRTTRNLIDPLKNSPDDIQSKKIDIMNRYEMEEDFVRCKLNEIFIIWPRDILNNLSNESIHLFIQQTKPRNVILLDDYFTRYNELLKINFLDEQIVKTGMDETNLCIINETLSSFDRLVLPRNLEVLQRCLNIILVDKLETKHAFEKVYNELSELYKEFSIQIKPKYEVVDKIKRLLVDYMEIFKNHKSTVIFQGWQEKHILMKLISKEEEFVVKLNENFKLWPENVFQHLKDDKSTKLFAQQIRPKKLNLLEDPLKRLATLSVIKLNKETKVLDNLSQICALVNELIFCLNQINPDKLKNQKQQLLTFSETKMHSDLQSFFYFLLKYMSKRSDSELIKNICDSNLLDDCNNTNRLKEIIDQVVILIKDKK